MFLGCFAFFDSIFGVARVIISLWLLLHIARACHFKWLGYMIEMPDKPFVKIGQMYKLKFIIYLKFTMLNFISRIDGINGLEFINRPFGM